MAQHRQKPNVCIVDDDDAVRNSLDLLLSVKGMTVLSFSTGKQMLQEGLALRCDMMILDIHMPEMDGFALLQELRVRGFLAPVILMSALGDQKIAARAEQSGVAAFFNKPIDPKALLETIHRLSAPPTE